MSSSSTTRPRRTIEREIIFAVIVLYLIITGVMVVVHYLQPQGQQTATSSSSPAHSDRSAIRPTGK